MNIAYETDEQMELRLRKEMGDAEYDRLANEDDSHIPTVEVGRTVEGASNVFLTFRSREDLEDLIHLLSAELSAGETKPAVSLRGRVMTFGEWCDANPEP